MNSKLVLFLLLCLSLQLKAQDSLKIFSWEEALQAPRDSVFAIDASRLKWESVPAELYTFTKLKRLDLSRNKLTSIPADFGAFKELKVIDLSRNKLVNFPVALCQLTTVRKLLLSRNLMTTLPECIGYFKDLTVLDLWDNPIETLPEQLSKLTMLKTVDLRGILFNKKFQEGWRAKMPGTNWLFDAPCECIQ